MGNPDLSSDEEEDPVALQARALYLAQQAGKPSNGRGLPVPYLNYDAYSDTVQSVQEVIKTASNSLADFQAQIRERKAEEHILHDIGTLNENIIETGKLLSGYISAQASYQDDMSQSSESFITDKEKEITMLSDQVSKLSDKLELSLIHI